MPSVMSSSRMPTIQVSSRGKFVGAEQEHLHHVDQHDGQHEVRTPAVQGADEPAQGDLVIENLQAVPRFSSGRHIDESQQNAGDQLKYEHSECGAAENVRTSLRIGAEPGAPWFRGSARPTCSRASNQSPTFVIRRMASLLGRY